jgi:predicted ATPase
VGRPLVGRTAAATSHQLEPLTRTDVEEPLAKMFHVASEAHDFAALLYGWTRGNPFFGAGRRL